MKKWVLLLALVILIISLAILSINFQIKGSIKIINSEGGELSFFTGKLLSYSIQGIIEKNSLFPLRFMEFEKVEVESPRIITIENKKYVLYANKNNFKIFSLAGELISTKSLEEEFKGKKIISSCISDLNNDYTDEILLILGDDGEEFGKEIIFYSWDEGLKKMFYQSFEGMNPWKIQTSDVDGDKNREISIAMYKETKFHPIPAKRPYIYYWMDNRIFPKWRGSRLSKPFDDYIFADIDNDGEEELISIEILQNGNKVINSYNWEGFGFEGLLQSNEYDDIIDLKQSTKVQGEIHIHIKENEDFKWIALEYNNDEFKQQTVTKEHAKEQIIIY